MTKMTKAQLQVELRKFKKYKLQSRKWFNDQNKCELEKKLAKEWYPDGKIRRKNGYVIWDKEVGDATDTILQAKIGKMPNSNNNKYAKDDWW